MNAVGSSPRMRGALTRVVLAIDVQRIIPAYAGSTVRFIYKHMSTWDHPRVCGEHSVPELRASLQRGSSPRMRGAPISVYGANAIGRIIPAYAGSTDQIEARIGGTEDHPRVCGEHAKPCDLSKAASGSSPRMRGAHALPAANRREHGIIPAYAGSTH